MWGKIQLMVSPAQYWEGPKVYQAEKEIYIFNQIVSILAVQITKNAQ